MGRMRAVVGSGPLFSVPRYIISRIIHKEMINWDQAASSSFIFHHSCHSIPLGFNSNNFKSRPEGRWNFSNFTSSQAHWKKLKIIYLKYCILFETVAPACCVISSYLQLGRHERPIMVLGTASSYNFPQSFQITQRDGIRNSTNSNVSRSHVSLHREISPNHPN